MNDIENLKKIILELAAPLVSACGLKIWGLELQAAPRLLVRLFVDLAHGQPPVVNDSAVQANKNDGAALYSPTIDQCEEISRQLGLALDVRDCISGAWVLEVSTPGLERRFFSLEQLVGREGDILDVVLNNAAGDGDFAGRKVFRGRLLEVDDHSFELQPCSIDNEGCIARDKLPPARIEWGNVKKARRVHVFNRPEKPGKRGKTVKQG